MTVAVNTILTKAGHIMQDAGRTRWTTAELELWLNEGQKTIASAIPESSSVTQNVTLVAGTRQSLPSGAITLLDIIRNMGTGAVPGKPVTRVSRPDMDVAYPGWAAATANKTVRNWMHDDNMTSVGFEVSPPVPEAPVVVVLARYSVVPTTVTSGGNISIPDKYESPLLDYVLYRGFIKDAENASYLARAAAHLKMFYESVGVNVPKPTAA